MSDKEDKPRRIRRRRTTGRVSGTSQSPFATHSMTSILQQQANEQAAKKRKKASSQDEESDAPESRKADKE